MPAAKRKAAPPPPQPAAPPPPELVENKKKSKKSQVIDQGGAPPKPVGLISARPMDAPLPTLHLVVALKPAPVPGAKRVGVKNPMEVETDGVENSNPSTSLLAPARLGGAASSSGHVKGDGKGGSKPGDWTSMQRTDLQQVEDEWQLLSIKDESDSRIARIKARNEAVVACVDSSPEEVQKALKWLAAVSARLLGSWRAKTRRPKTRTAAAQTDAIEARLVERLHRTSAAKVYINKSGHKSHICKVCVKHRFCFVPGKDVMGRDLPIDDVSAYTGKQKYVIQKIIEKDATKKQEYDDAVATRSRDVLRAYVNSQVPKNAKYGWTVVASS